MCVAAFTMCVTPLGTCVVAGLCQRKPVRCWVGASAESVGAPCSLQKSPHDWALSCAQQASSNCYMTGDVMVLLFSCQFMSQKTNHTANKTPLF